MMNFSSNDFRFPEKSQSGGFLPILDAGMNIANLIVRNKALINAGMNATKGALSSR